MRQGAPCILKIPGHAAGRAVHALHDEQALRGQRADRLGHEDAGVPGRAQALAQCLHQARLADEIELARHRLPHLFQHLQPTHLVGGSEATIFKQLITFTVR